jgi:hypothetical protein
MQQSGSGLYIKRVMALFFIVALGFAGGCKRVARPTKEALEARAKEYWDLRVRGDWQQIYSYLCPEERKHISKEIFARQRSAQFSTPEYKIEEVLVQGTEGETVVKFNYRIVIPQDTERFRKGETSLTDSWVFADGDWYVRLQTLGPGLKK